MLWKKVFSREYTVQYCEVALNSISEKVKHLVKNAGMEKLIILPQHKNQCFYFEEREKKKFIEFIVEEFTGDPKRFDGFKILFKKLGNDYVDVSKRIGKLNFNDFDNNKLKDLFLEYQKIALDYTCIIWITFLLNEHWSERGHKLVDKYDDKIKEALFRPIKRSTVLIMQEEASKIKGKDEEIRKFWNKYKWISCLDLQNKPWSLKDVEDYVNNLKQGEQYEKLNFDEAVKKANLNNDKKEMFQMIKVLGYIKDARDDYRRKGVFYIQSLFAEIGKRMNISQKEVAYLTEEEIINFLEGKQVNLSKGKKRQEGFLLYLKDDEVVCVDHAINEELTKIGFSEEEIKVSEIKGTVACQGKARGTAKIVRTVHDILKINKGDVLVAVTTHPDYVPAMQKSAAIVTDEGGMLSHAAIVSRELGIPCVVGTEIATKVIQHGQKVEVDATNGVVRLLE
jgi:phosphohistidine swiveling domain-containing protein